MQHEKRKESVRVCVYIGRHAASLYSTCSRDAELRAGDLFLLCADAHTGRVCRSAPEAFAQWILVVSCRGHASNRSATERRMRGRGTPFLESERMATGRLAKLPSIHCLFL